ncbi:hypothetical protein [uncultured Sanguibacteroides sp.]|uniref:hypothetical protein n=1 Tax=uncultured Sanguibacteroides sp. TaxID=1635151 RepID=UPI0025E26580|nr:hypothetical protein [uncultured Sanguibacteroides sp.]
MYFLFVNSSFFYGQDDDMEKGEEILTRIERMVEMSPLIARIDKEKAIVRLQVRLDRMVRQRKVLRRCLFVVTSVASVVIFSSSKARVG